MGDECGSKRPCVTRGMGRGSGERSGAEAGSQVEGVAWGGAWGRVVGQGRGAGALPSSSHCSAMIGHRSRVSGPPWEPAAPLPNHRGWGIGGLGPWTPWDFCRGGGWGARFPWERVVGPQAKGCSGRVCRAGWERTTSWDVSWEEEGPGCGSRSAEPVCSGAHCRTQQSSGFPPGLPARRSGGEPCCRRSDGPVSCVTCPLGVDVGENQWTLTLDLFTVGGRGLGRGERERENG